MEAKSSRVRAIPVKYRRVVRNIRYLLKCTKVLDDRACKEGRPASTHEVEGEAPRLFVKVLGCKALV